MPGFYTALTSLLGTWITGVFGPGAERAVVGSITWADVAAIASTLLLVLMVNTLAAAVVRHKLKQTAAAAQTQLRHHAFGALSKPLYVLIWVCGSYFVATALLAKLTPAQGSRILQQFFDEVFNLGVFLVMFWFFFRFTHVLEARMALWASRTSSKLDDLFVPLLGRGLRVMLPVVGVIFALPILKLSPAYAGVVARGTSVLLILALAAVLVQAVKVCENALLLRFDITAADNLRARKVYTQVHVISRVVYVVIGLFSVACVLMLFQEVRQVGTSLLASAGIVGIIAGVAGQKTLANLFAGFQIALAQPIRQDDVVIVEGEWGRVEEITLSYVVVHIWDDRRLVLPLSYFIEKPFQNWTRASARLLGSVYVWVDYSFPVDEGRKALKQIIEQNPLWDRRFWNLQVSDASDRTMQLRVLATSEDSSKSWDLRCEIREQFIAYILRSHPSSLPQLRTQLAVSGNSVAS